MKQTAADWLFTQLWETPKDKFTWYKILMDAKEIEEKQIVTSWHNGYENQSPMIDEDNCGETYYKETYGDL